tara:strand:+ start:667 stop:963 length:297 start_codon:yes stop_codon:yes gene_type:complete
VRRSKHLVCARQRWGGELHEGKPVGVTHSNGPTSSLLCLLLRASSPSPLLTQCGRGDEVNITSLDDFAAGDAPIYVKVDVEGGEWDVLRGVLPTANRR